MVALLSHPIVYIEGYRANTKASDLSKGERVTDTNFFDANFSVNPTEEKDNIGYEIWPEVEPEIMPDFLFGDWNSSDFKTAV